MSTDFSEDTLVEQPAIALFSELGYETANCFYEKVGGSSSTLGRNDRRSHSAAEAATCFGETKSLAVNGLPLILIELKKSHGKIEHVYKHNLKDYKQTVPQLFWYNALIILSNGSRAKVGSITAGWEHFADWKRITTSSPIWCDSNN